MEGDPCSSLWDDGVLTPLMDLEADEFVGVFFDCWGVEEP